MQSVAPILLAEDNEDDVFLIRRAFEKAHILNPLQHVRNGREAIAYLSGEGPYENRAEFPVPELLLLDLKIPELDGFEVLRWVRQQPALGALRVVVLTCSADVHDVNFAFQLGANSFMIKPADFLRLVEFSDAIAGHWLWLSKAPESPRPALSLQTRE